MLISRKESIMKRFFSFFRLSLYSLIVLLSIVCLGLTIHANEQNNEGCWKKTYDRGVGLVPVDCAAGTEKDELLCYPECPQGFTGKGPVCWQNCPLGFIDTGAFCLKPSSYDLGEGYPWKIGDPIGSDSAQWRRCESDHGKGNCHKEGLIVYPQCKPDFHVVGCCICSVNCPAGMDDWGASCRKQTKPRGAGKAGSCASDKEYDAGLCYNKCNDDSVGIGTTCWSKCPAEYPFDCGALCAKSQEACANNILYMAKSTGDLMINVAALIGTAGEAETAIEAARLIAKQAGKEVLTNAAKETALTAARKAFAATPTIKKMKRERKNINPILNKLSAAVVNSKEQGEFDWTVLDPIGVDAVVKSFDKPICGSHSQKS
jgi:hypothetical protein